MTDKLHTYKLGWGHGPVCNTHGDTIVSYMNTQLYPTRIQSNTPIWTHSCILHGYNNLTHYIVSCCTIELDKCMYLPSKHRLQRA
jgi:hypothetical protein